MRKPELPQLEDERILLRPLAQADLPETLAWRNQPDIRKWFVNTAVIQEQQHHEWFDRYLQLDNDFVFVIVAKDLDGIPIGQVALYNIDWQAGEAEFGRLMIGYAPARGRGYAGRATRVILRRAFDELKLVAVRLEVKEGNQAAIAIYESAGFVQTGKSGGLLRMVSDGLHTPKSTEPGTHP